MRLPGPPAVLRRVPRALLPATARADALVGDLDELWAERRARRGALRAALWYAGQAAWAYWTYRERDRGARAIVSATRGTVRGCAAALRRLAKAPAYSVAAVATLGLGVGAATTVYSLIAGVLMEPLPYPAPDRIVSVQEDNDGLDVPVGWAAAGSYLEWRDRASSFESLALFRGRSVGITTEAVPEYAYGALVTPEFFDVFGTEPMLGRGFGPEDAQPGVTPVAILGHGLWTRGFGADPALVGESIRIDGSPHVVVGVMPPGFEAHGDWVGLPVQVWRPFHITDDVLGQGRSYHVAGRLAEGVGLAAARDELRALSAELARTRPDENGEWYARVAPYRELIVGDITAELWLMLATASLLLVIACANVANLGLNRVLDRGRELATRRALGAGRASVVGLVVAESALIALVGGAAGVAISRGLVAAVRAVEPGRIPRLDEVAVDGGVLVFALVLVGLAAMGSGVAAAFAALRPAPARVLRAGRSGGRSGARVRAGLVTAQLVLSFALVATAGLLARSFLGLRSTDLGFDSDRVTAATVALSWSRVGSLEARVRFTREVLAAIRELPGVESAGMINSLPLSGSNSSMPLEIEGVSEPGREPTLAARGISPGYLETLGIPVLAGRALEEADVLEGRSVLVNRAAAVRFWPDGDAVGRRVREPGSDMWSTVVGVVGDVRHYGPDRPARPEVYVPYSAEGLTSKSYVVRWAVGAGAAERIRTVVTGVDPNQPVREIRDMSVWAERATAEARFRALAMIATALLATVLAGVGLFGLLAGAVRARAPELALRSALGARRGSVLSLVLRQAGGLVLLGLSGGAGLALLLGGALEGFLVDVSPRDPVTLVTAALFFVLVGLAATVPPVRRATAVDPASTLRAD